MFLKVPEGFQRKRISRCPDTLLLPYISSLKIEEYYCMCWNIGMDNSRLYYCGLDGRLPRHIWVMGLGRKYRDMINLMILTKLLKIFELRLDVRRGMGGTWSESRILGTSEDRHYYISPASRASNEGARRFYNHGEGLLLVESGYYCFHTTLLRRHYDKRVLTRVE